MTSSLNLYRDVWCDDPDDPDSGMMDFDGLMFLKVSEFALDEQRRKAMFEQVKSDFLFLIKSIYGNEKEKKDFNTQIP
mgnify:CR=1 FL=1